MLNSSYKQKKKLNINIILIQDCWIHYYFILNNCGAWIQTLKKKKNLNWITGSTFQFKKKSVMHRNICFTIISFKQVYVFTKIFSQKISEYFTGSIMLKAIINAGKRHFKLFYVDCKSISIAILMFLVNMFFGPSYFSDLRGGGGHEFRKIFATAKKNNNIIGATWHSFNFVKYHQGFINWPQSDFA